MILRALESIYVTIRRLQIGEPAGRPRMNPGFSLVVIITPVIYAALFLAIGHSPFLSEPITQSFFRSAPRLYWLAALIATITVVLAFDRRRLQIERKFSSLPALTTAKQKAWALVANILLVISLAVLSSRAPVVCVATFFTALVALDMVVKRLRAP